MPRAYPSQFEDLWPYFGRKQQKRLAWEAWEAAGYILPEHPELLRRIKRLWLMQWRYEPQYCPLPWKWFAEERWEDEPLPHPEWMALRPETQTKILYDEGALEPDEAEEYENRMEAKRAWVERARAEARRRSEAG